MFGHVLRGPIDGRHFFSLIYEINTLQLPGRRESPQRNLFSFIVEDLRMRSIFLNKIHDLSYLRHIVSDRNT